MKSKSLEAIWVRPCVVVLFDYILYNRVVIGARAGLFCRAGVHTSLRCASTHAERVLLASAVFVRIKLKKNGCFDPINIFYDNKNK